MDPVFQLKQRFTVIKSKKQETETCEKKRKKSEITEKTNKPNVEATLILATTIQDARCRNNLLLREMS